MPGDFTIESIKELLCKKCSGFVLLDYLQLHSTTIKLALLGHPTILPQYFITKISLKELLLTQYTVISQL